MRLKKPHVASVDEVRISRHSDEAVIAHVEPGFWTTHLRLGPEVQRMTGPGDPGAAQRGDRDDGPTARGIRARRHRDPPGPAPDRALGLQRPADPPGATSFAASSATAGPRVSPSSTSTSMISPGRSSATC